MLYCEEGVSKVYVELVQTKDGWTLLGVPEVTNVELANGNGGGMAILKNATESIELPEEISRDRASFFFQREMTSPRHVILVGDSNAQVQGALVMVEGKLVILPVPISPELQIPSEDQSWHIVPVQCRHKKLPFLDTDPLLDLYRYLFNFILNYL